MNQIPLKFKIELEDMGNLYPTIQDLRLFKEEVDQRLINKLHRNSIGRIEAHHHWSKYAALIKDQLVLEKATVGDCIIFDMSTLDVIVNNTSSLIDCGQVIHAYTKEEPYWQLSYSGLV